MNFWVLFLYIFNSWNFSLVIYMIFCACFQLNELTLNHSSAHVFWLNKVKTGGIVYIYFLIIKKMLGWLVLDSWTPAPNTHTHRGTGSHSFQQLILIKDIHLSWYLFYHQNQSVKSLNHASAWGFSTIMAYL